jgi:hypothetical protein
MVSLTTGIVLTLVAWLGLMIAVVHGKYVTEKIWAGEYHKGPLKRREDSDVDGGSNVNGDPP